MASPDLSTLLAARFANIQNVLALEHQATLRLVVESHRSQSKEQTELPPLSPRSHARHPTTTSQEQNEPQHLSLLKTQSSRVCFQEHGSADVQDNSHGSTSEVAPARCFALPGQQKEEKTREPEGAEEESEELSSQTSGSGQIPVVQIRKQHSAGSSAEMVSVVPSRSNSPLDSQVLTSLVPAPPSSPPGPSLPASPQGPSPPQEEPASLTVLKQSLQSARLHPPEDFEHDQMRGSNSASSTPPATPRPLAYSRTQESCFSSEIADREDRSYRRGCSRTNTISDGKFRVNPVWDHSDGLSQRSVQKTVTRSASRGIIRRVSLTEQTFDFDGQAGCRWMVQPNAPKRLLWDIIGITMITHDLIFEPLQFFDLPQTKFNAAMTWLTRLFWTGDVPGSFLTGFIRPDGTYEMSPRLIARRYARTWMLLDLVLVISDWSGVIVDSVSDANVLSGDNSLKTMRIVRMLRMIRLLRVARMPMLFSAMVERAGAAEFVLSCDILKITSFFVGVAHVIACLWYAIGLHQLQSDEPNWLQGSGSFTDAEFGYRYATSLHWSVTQFIGSMEVRPHNSLERAFAVMVLVFAFILAACFVSSITSAMTRHQISATKQTNQISALRRFLNQNGISQRLSMRIQRNAQFSFQELQRNMPEAEVELLALVSEPLRIELHFELFSPELLRHPFFALYYEQHPAVIRKVCHTAVSLKALSMGDILFNTGEVPTSPEMFALRHGSMQYSTIEDNTDVEEGACICEAMLWCARWTHQGTLTAATDCIMVVMKAHKFQEIATFVQDLAFSVLDYAQGFVEELNDSDLGARPSDLGSREEIASLVQRIYFADDDGIEDVLPSRDLSFESRGSRTSAGAWGLRSGLPGQESGEGRSGGTKRRLSGTMAPNNTGSWRSALASGWALRGFAWKPASSSARVRAAGR